MIAIVAVVLLVVINILLLGATIILIVSPDSNLISLPSFFHGWGTTNSECRPSNRTWQYWLLTSICAFRGHPRVTEEIKGKTEGADVTAERCTRCGNTKYFHFGSYLMGHHIYGKVEDYFPDKEVSDADQS